MEKALPSMQEIKPQRPRGDFLIGVLVKICVGQLTHCCLQSRYALNNIISTFLDISMYNNQAWGGISLFYARRTLTGNNLYTSPYLHHSGVNTSDFSKQLLDMGPCILRVVCYIGVSAELIPTQFATTSLSLWSPAEGSAREGEAPFELSTCLGVPRITWWRFFGRHDWQIRDDLAFKRR